MDRHKDLFFLCDNCANPVILSQEMQQGVLQKARFIRCHYCEYENWDIEKLKQYSKWIREYAKG